MSAAVTPLAERAAALRLAFDHSFAEPARADPAAMIDMLAIRLDAQPYLLRLAEIAGLFTGKTLTLVPGGNAALLGIAGFRGSIVPVYDLQAVIGLSGRASPRWFVLADAASVAFAFEGFDGRLRVAAESILPARLCPQSRSCTQGFVQADNSVRPIIHLPSALHAIET